MQEKAGKCVSPGTEVPVETLQKRADVTGCISATFRDVGGRIERLNTQGPYLQQMSLVMQKGEKTVCVTFAIGYLSL